MDKAEYVFYKLAQGKENAEGEWRLFDGESTNFDGLNVSDYGSVSLKNPHQNYILKSDDYISNVVNPNMTRERFSNYVPELKRISRYINRHSGPKEEKDRLQIASSYNMNKKVDSNNPAVERHKRILEEGGYRIGDIVPKGSPTYKKLRENADKGNLLLNRRRNKETNEYDIIGQNDNMGYGPSQNFA